MSSSKYVYIVVYVFLLMHISLSGMQIKKSKPFMKRRTLDMDNDSIKYMFNFCSISSVNSLLQTCTSYYQLYPIDNIYRQPLDTYLSTNKELCYKITQRQHLYGLIHYSQSNNSHMVKMFIACENEINKKKRQECLYCFGYLNQEEHDNETIVMSVYKGIQKGEAVINKKDLYFNTGKAYNLAAIQILLKNGVNPNIVDTFGATILHTIMYSSFVTRWFLKILVESGVALNQEDCARESALDVALRLNKRSLAYCLVELGAYKTPLFLEHWRNVKGKKMKERIMEKRKAYLALRSNQPNMTRSSG